MALLVKEIMVSNPICLLPDQTVYSAREQMIINEYHTLFVVDKKKRPIGMVSTLYINTEDMKKSVDKVMMEDVQTIHINQTVREAAHVFSKMTDGMMVLPVTGDDGELIGICRIRDIVKDLTRPPEKEGALSPEAAVIYLAMTKSDAKEKFWLQRAADFGLKAAITQVGANAEKLPIKLRESSIVAAIAYGVIREDLREKIAVSNAIRDIILQLKVISPGLGGGFKMGIVRGEGRISVAAFGRCGHALANSTELIFVGTSII